VFIAILGRLVKLLDNTASDCYGHA